MKTFLFPGQGSQPKGMGATLFDEFKELTEKADVILGYSIKELCLNDPKKKLNKTQFTQPAIFVVNALSYYKKIEASGQKPDFVAGHSLGEFNALLAAECFDFETGLKIVKKRGELMSQTTGGGMAAILNATKEEIQSILEKNELTNIELANYNTPSQIVVSGLKDKIIKAQSFFSQGDIKYIPLNTSGAFHSQYMEPAREEFSVFIEKLTFSDLKIPVISNVSAQPYKNDETKINISSQITSPVQWTNSIQYLIGLGDMEFEEIGGTNILLKMVGSIQKSMPKTLQTKPHKKKINPLPSIQEKSKENTPKEPIKLEKKKKDNDLTAQEKVDKWNQNQPIGTKVKSLIVKDKELETRTEAIVLFGHRAAIYMKDYNGYFDLDEIVKV